MISKGRSYNTYVFKHSAIQECCYNLLLPSQRQQLHEAIAEWYERRHRRLAPHYHILANHWMKANNCKKALEYTILAGEKALDEYANLEVVDFFTQAISLFPKVEFEVNVVQKAHCERCLGEAFYNLGDFKVCL